MRKKFIVVFALFVMSAFLNADTLQRLSAIATGGIPWDNKAVAIYDYLADRSALAIIDIADSSLPVLTFRTSGVLSRAAGVDIKDTLCYINHLGIRFWVGNVKPPDSIIFLSYFDLPNPALLPEPWGIEVRDTILYVAVGSEGLYIFNIKDPMNPTQITFYDTPYNLTEFFILDSLIYLADCDSMIILNIKDPASPFHVGAVDIPWYCTDVHVVWPYAYATSYGVLGVDGSIQIINISNPANPAIVGSINGIRGDPRAIFINDDYIYCASMDWWFAEENNGKTRADVEGGIRIAQGVTPDSLIISYDTPGDPREVFVRGNLILVPDSDSLQILYHNKTGIEESEGRIVPLLKKFITYPNPTRDHVTCEMVFYRSSRIEVCVYDEFGRKVREIYNGPMIAGNVQFYWDGRDKIHNQVPSGEYFIRISSQDGKSSDSKKVVYLGNINKRR